MEVSPPPFTLAVFDEEKLLLDVNLNKPDEVYHLNPDYLNPLCFKNNETEKMWGPFEPNLSFGDLDGMLMNLCEGKMGVTLSLFKKELDTVKYVYRNQKKELENIYTEKMDQLKSNWRFLDDFFAKNMGKFHYFSAGVDVEPVLTYTLGQPDFNFQWRTNQFIKKIDKGRTARINKVVNQESSPSHFMRFWRSLQVIKNDEKRIIEACCNMQWVEMEKETIKKIYEPSIRTFKKEAAQDKSVFEACQFFGIII